MSLFSALAVFPSGRDFGGGEVGIDTVMEHLRRFYLGNREQLLRREKMRKRLRYYRDDFDEYIRTCVKEIFHHELTQGLRIELIKFAKSNNVVRRITQLMSTVYHRPATRIVDSEQDEFDEYEIEVALHKKMRRAQRMSHLSNAVAIYPSFSPGGKRRMRVVDQSQLFAVSHPLDTGEPVAYIFDVNVETAALRDSESMPRWLVLDDTYSFLIDQRNLYIGGSLKPHNVGRIPVAFYSRSEDESLLLDTTTGDDIVSAQEAIILLEVMAMKNAKSGEKIGYTTGDMTRATFDNAFDQEVMPHLPAGSAAGTLDLGANPGVYRSQQDAIANTLFGNRGIPSELRTANITASSGSQLLLRKSELADLRADDLIDWREVERDRFDLEARTFGLNTRGARVDFAELTVHRDRSDQLDIDRQERNEGRTNIFAQMQRDNPDASIQEIEQQWLENVRIQSQTMTLVRALNLPGDSDFANPGQTPQLNGAEGGPPEPESDQMASPADRE